MTLLAQRISARAIGAAGARTAAADATPCFLRQ
jgi:hypothetical protein